jgi:hypothetical protein
LYIAVLRKFIAAYPFKKVSSFYKTLRFIFVFTRSHYWLVKMPAESVIIFSRYIILISVLILYFGERLHVFTSSRLTDSSFITVTVYPCLIGSLRATYPAHTIAFHNTGDTDTLII